MLHRIIMALYFGRGKNENFNAVVELKEPIVLKWFVVVGCQPLFQL